MLEESPDVCKVIYSSSSYVDEIIAAGEEIILKLYGGKCSNLNDLQILKCGCKTNCGSNKCSCRRAMLECSDYCCCSEEKCENHKMYRGCQR